MEQSNIRRERLVRLTAGLLTLLILFAVYYLRKLAPFGDGSLAREDANIQYLQFFAYLKDVLAGKQSLRYSLTIGLGLGGVPILNYYLQSPFNLLVLFFSKSQLPAFLDITVALKLALGAALFTWYLQERFRHALRPALVLSLALCYGLMQYGIAQSSNLMWLDGVYLLPLILLGIYRIVREGRPGLLAGAFAVNLIFNWYIAAVNALFSLGILLLELAFREESGKGPSFGGALLQWVRAGIRSLLLSAVSFLPMVLYLLRGKGASWDAPVQWGTLLGDPLETLRSFRIWSICQPGSVTWYCGSIALMGLILFLVIPGISKKKKCAGLLAVLVMNLCYYWQPLFHLFSLLQEPMGHWCRYSYLGSALLLILSAHALMALQERREQGQSGFWPVALSAGITALMLILFNLGHMTMDRDRALLTTAFLLASALGILAAGPGMKHRTLAWILPVIVTAELSCNAWGLAGFYASPDGAEYRTYVTEQSRQIDALQSADPGIYRIAQTSVRRVEENGRTAAFDEGMAFGYDSNAAYHSVPDNRQLRMMDALGYPTEAGCMNIVNTTILPADSLLGVKYILSSVPLPGLILREDLPEANGKRVYENPDAFPMAFLTSAASVEGGTEDPFQNANAMIRALTGITEDVFLPASYRTAVTDNGVSVSIDGNEAMPILYAAFPDRGEEERGVAINGLSTVTVGGWLSPEVLMLSSDGAQTELILEEETDPGILLYRMNGAALRQASETARQNRAELTSGGGGSFTVTASAKDGEALYLNIPWSPDFSVTVNGEKTSAFPAGTDNAMMRIPLTEGENTVSLKYHIPGLLPGLLLTVLTALALMLRAWRKKN